MDELFVWGMSKLGVSAGIVYLALFLLRHFSKTERQNWVEVYEGFVDLGKNVVRRWNSERARSAEVYAKAREIIESADASDDEKKIAERKLAMESAKTEAKGIIRVVSGTIEDVGNIVVDLVFLIVPFLAASVAAYRKGHPKVKV